MQNHNQWGNSILFQNYELGRLMGHTRQKPCVGDEIICEMKSGKTALFVFAEIKYCTDPKNQWFATVHPVGYIDGNESKGVQP